MRPEKELAKTMNESVLERVQIPIMATAVITTKPSARPTQSTNLPMGILKTPPMTFEIIPAVAVKGNRAKLEVTYEVTLP